MPPAPSESPARRPTGELPAPLALLRLLTATGSADAAARPLGDPRFAELAALLRDWGLSGPERRVLCLGCDSGRLAAAGGTAADRRDVAALAAAHGFDPLRAGVRPLSQWDGTAFHLR